MTSKWRVEERVGAATRTLTVDATSWETAIEAAWATWELAHLLRRCGVEVGLSATQVFVRGTDTSYRVAPEAAPKKRVVPRPVSSMPPPMPMDDPEGTAKTQMPQPLAPRQPEPKKLEPKPVATAGGAPKKPELRRDPRKVVAAQPSGRSLFGSLPRATGSRPDPAELRGSRPDPAEVHGSKPDPVEAKSDAPRITAQPDSSEAITGRPLTASQVDANEARPRSEPPRPRQSKPPVPLEITSAVERLTGGHTPGAFPKPPRLPAEVPAPAEAKTDSAAPSEPIVPTPIISVPPPPPVPEVMVAPAPAPAKPVTPPPIISMRRLQVLVAGAVQLYAREQDPKHGAPVVYRQRGYALPMGTEDDEAEAFGRWMLQQLKQQIPGGEAPRLFHLAIYDEMFTGEPPILAVCKLEWKEWKDQINVSFPRRGDEEEDDAMAAPRARTPSMHPPAEATPPAPPPPPAPPKRAAALFLPPVTPPSAFAVQPPPKLPSTKSDEGSKGSK